MNTPNPAGRTGPGEAPEQQALGRTLSCLGLGILSFLLVGQGLGLLGGMVQRWLAQRGVALSPVGGQVANLAVYTLSILAPIWVMVRLLGAPARSWFPAARPRLGLLLPAVGFTMGVAVAANLLSAWLTQVIQRAAGVALPGFSPGIGQSPLGVLLTLLSTALAPAVLEELLFRGVVLQSLRRFGDAFGVVFSALVFGLCHTTVGQWIPAFAAGLCMGWFVVESGSVVTGMIIHFVYNLLITLISIGGAFGGEQQQVMGTALLIGASALACLASLFWLERRRGGRRLFRPGGTPLTRGQRARGVVTSVPLMLAFGLLLWTTLQKILS